jgi:hypothetical protein
MATTDIRLDILFKKSLGLPDAFPNKPSSNEVAVGSNRPAVLPASQIYQQPIPSTAPSDLVSASFTVGNGAAQLGGNPATKQVSTAYPYIAKYNYIPLIDATGNSNNKVSYCYKIGSGNILQNSISSAYDIAGSYGISLFTNAGTPLLSSNATDGWVIDNDSGVVTFTNSTTNYYFTSGPPFISFWRYEGAFGIQNFSTDITMNNRLFVAGDVSMNSRLFVGNDVIINGRLNVYEYTNTNLMYTNVTTTNYTLIIAEDISLNGRLNVNYDASLNARLFVNNDVSMNANLYTLGRTIHQGDVSMNTRLFVSGDVSMNSRLFAIGSILSGINYVDRLSELIYNSASAAIAFDYNNGSTFYVATPTTANFTAAFTNVPTTANRTFVASIILNASSNKFYASAVTVNGNASTLLFNGGASAISVSSATAIVQTFAFVIGSGGTIIYVLSNVASYQA